MCCRVCCRMCSRLVLKRANVPNESFHTYQRVTSHISMSPVTQWNSFVRVASSETPRTSRHIYQCVTSRNETYSYVWPLLKHRARHVKYTSMRHVTQWNSFVHVPCGLFWNTMHVNAQTGHVERKNESLHTYWINESRPAIQLIPAYDLFSNTTRANAPNESCHTHINASRHTHWINESRPAGRDRNTAFARANAPNESCLTYQWVTSYTLNQ